MNRAERRDGITRSRLPRGGRLIAVAVSAAVALATGLLVAPPASAALPPADAVYTVGDIPMGIATDSTGTIAVTVNVGDNTASVIDLGTSVVSSVTLDTQEDWRARDVAVDPSGTYAYVTNFHTGSISRIDLSDNSVTQIPVGGNPTRIVIDPAGVYAYVTVGAAADRITLSDLTVVRSFLSPVTGPLIFTSDGATIYSYDGTATRFDAVSGNATATFSTGAGTVTGAAFNANQTAIYGVNSDGWIRKTELATELTEVWVGNGPNTGTNSNSLVSVGNYAYVPVINDGTLKQVNLRLRNSFTSFASNLSGPSDVAVPANEKFILVASSGAGKVFRYDFPSPPGEGSRALVWGLGRDSALGTGTTSNWLTPVPMAAGANEINTWGTNWYSMDGGYDQTCGVGTDQRAYCWGLNSSGQLGNGTTDDTNVPVAVAPGANTGNMWVSVSAGSDYSSCGIGTDAEAYCWGSNGSGRLGNGTTDDSSLVPVAVVNGPESWSSVRVGNTHACGVGTDAEAYCWGKNSSGELGDGTIMDSPVAVRVLGGPEHWAEVSAGTEHTCGISSDSKAYCWGKNIAGELGIGSLDDTVVPVEVENGHNTDGTWKSIVTGYYATCAIGGDDKAYCWGLDTSGQLGNGTDADQLEPMSVALPIGVSVRMIAMDAYAEHVCAVSTGNVVYCWGYNGEGQLGNGPASNSDVPVEVDLNAFPTANLAAGTPRMVAVGSGISLMVSSFGAAPAFTAASPPSTGTVGVAYPPYSFTASGSTPITFTRASGTLPPGLTLVSNGVLSGTPTTAGTYTFTVSASNGITPGATTSSITITITSSVTPGPAPATPASPPQDVRAIPGIELATVSWLTPASTGSFPVTSYQAVATPGGQTCMVAAPALTCTITGLTPGTSYKVTARALTGAGWSAESSPGTTVVPLAAPETPSILITSSRDRAQKSVARIEGTTTGLVGAKVVPYLRFAKQGSFRPGKRTQTVDAQGNFVWQRKAKKRFTVYFVSGDVRSNRLVIRPE